ncbi:hypothetical protein D9756_002414 [Leucocoprinus leucothites]|uniref:F-box domain-containing protein n=1 Tax=Leucocoprinus leucothites TaxID=201217 RepID=A0A8H5LME2_9AGAR|nr:hypothetical protein D9756_002414 [Leucoagaricus leucothites]
MEQPSATVNNQSKNPTSNLSTTLANTEGGGGEQPGRKKKKRKNKKRKTTNAEPNNLQPHSTPSQSSKPPQPMQRPADQSAKHTQPPQHKHLVSSSATKAGTVAVVKPLHEFPRFCDLPPELQKRIFEIAYRSFEEEARPSEWIYISRNVREWCIFFILTSSRSSDLTITRLEPFLYVSIILPHDFEYRADKVLPLYERTFYSRPKEFYAKSVKRIYTNNQIRSEDSDFELKLLPVCDNLTSLECWSDRKEELTAILTMRHWPKLRTLCLDINLLPKDENMFHLPLFRHVTRLDLISKEPQLSSWKSLSSLDNLTHMRVYMLVTVKKGESRKAIDLVYAIATEVQKCLPRNMRHFVILVPVDLLYYIPPMKHSTSKDKERWDKMESIRIGTFDPRIMLGSSGDWDKWLDENLSDADEEGEDALREYCQFIPQLTYPSWPRDYLMNEEEDTWTEVIMKDRRRVRFLASRKK